MDKFRPDSFLPLTPVAFEILLALADGERHGYSILQEVESRSGGTVALHAGTLYRALARLLESDLIEECKTSPDPANDDERRRYYGLTTRGIAVARAEVARLEGQLHGRTDAQAPERRPRMNAPRRSWIAEALFSLGLLAYPRAFRDRFGFEMRDGFRAKSRPSGFATLVTNGIAERWAAVKRWAFFPNHTPHLYEPSGRHFMFWDTLRADIRHTLRLAVKTPVFTSLTILALALGIGATSAIFAVVNGVLLRSMPYRDDGRLVNLWSYNTSENRPRNPISPANFLDFQRMNTTLDGLEGYFTFVTPTQLVTDSGTEVAYSVFVTSNMFNMLGRTAATGRTFTLGEESGVVVLSDGYWRRRFGADPAVIGKTLSVSGQTLQVIGIMPPDFVFPYAGMLGPSGFTRVTGIDMWLPIAFSGPMAVNNRMLTQSGQIVRNVHWFGAIGRLKAGVSPQQAEADMMTIASQLEQAYPGDEQGMACHRGPVDRSIGRHDSPGLDDPAGRHRVRARDGLGQRRQPAARAQHRARKGTGDARRPRRRPRAPRAAIADREPALRPRRRHRRHDRHELDAARPDCARPSRSAAHERGQRRLARAARRRADDDAHRRARRRAAGAELGEREPAGQLAGWQPRHGRRHASPPRPRRPGRRGSRAGRRDHHRRRAAAAQLRVGHEREPGL